MTPDNQKAQNRDICTCRGRRPAFDLWPPTRPDCDSVTACQHRSAASQQGSALVDEIFEIFEILLLLLLLLLLAGCCFSMQHEAGPGPRRQALAQKIPPTF